MPVEIAILSGARQGERFTVEKDRFFAGSEPADAVSFSAARDPNIVGRRAEFRRDGEGWQIVNVGGGPLMVNRARVTDAARIRSGDIVRMSEAGPDFSFNVVSKASAPSPPVGAPAVALPAAVPEEVPASASGGGVWKADRAWFRQPLVLVGALLLTAALAVWLQARTPPVKPTKLQLPDLSDQTVPAGETLYLSFGAVSGAQEGRKLTYRFANQAPDNMLLDSATGEFVWTPTGAQASAQYPVTIAVESEEGDGAEHDETSLVIRVTPVTLAPHMEPIPDQVIDLREPKSFQFAVTAVDPSLPAAPLRFRFGEGALPDGLQIDAESGVISWRPTEPAPKAGASWKIRVVATQRREGGESAEQNFELNFVRSDLWGRAAEIARESAYLLVVKQPQAGRVFPLAPVYAVGTRELLTSASLATELAKLVAGGAQVDAINFSSGKEYRVTSIQVCKHFQNLPPGSPDQLYFDLALLTVNRDLAPIGAVAAPPAAANAATELRCVVFPPQGDWLARLSAGELQLAPCEVVATQAAPLQVDPPPRRLRLRAALQAPAFGAPVINELGQVVAVYARPVPAAAGENGGGLHDATAAPSVELIQDRGDRFWAPVRIEPSRTPSPTN